MTSVLDIELLRTFHAVARLGRFRAAGEHVNRSPAAVGLHIQRLEAAAGGRLLEPDNQSVTLTALGKMLLSTGDLLAAHDRRVDELKGKRLAGRVVFGIPDEYAAHVIHDILPDLASSWLDVMHEVKTAPSYELRDQMARGGLHMLIVVQPAHGSRSANVLTLTTPALFGSLTFGLDDTRPVPLALYAEPCPYRAAMTGALEAAGRKWRVVLDSGSTQVIKACVESGLAVTLLHRARVTANMRVVDGLPHIVEHEVVLMCANTGLATGAIDLLAQALRQQFRL